MLKGLKKYTKKYTVISALSLSVALGAASVAHAQYPGANSQLTPEQLQQLMQSTQQNIQQGGQQVIDQGGYNAQNMPGVSQDMLNMMNNTAGQAASGQLGNGMPAMTPEQMRAMGMSEAQIQQVQDAMGAAGNTGAPSVGAGGMPAGMPTGGMPTGGGMMGGGIDKMTQMPIDSQMALNEITPSKLFSLGEGADMSAYENDMLAIHSFMVGWLTAYADQCGLEEEEQKLREEQGRHKTEVSSVASGYPLNRLDVAFNDGYQQRSADLVCENSQHRNEFWGGYYALFGTMTSFIGDLYTQIDEGDIFDQNINAIIEENHEKYKAAIKETIDETDATPQAKQMAYQAFISHTPIMPDENPFYKVSFAHGLMNAIANACAKHSKGTRGDVNLPLDIAELEYEYLEALEDMLGIKIAKDPQDFASQYGHLATNENPSRIHAKTAHGISYKYGYMSGMWMAKTNQISDQIKDAVENNRFPNGVPNPTQDIFNANGSGDGEAHGVFASICDENPSIIPNIRKAVEAERNEAHPRMRTASKDPRGQRLLVRLYNDLKWVPFKMHPNPNPQLIPDQSNNQTSGNNSTNYSLRGGGANNSVTTSTSTSTTTPMASAISWLGGF